MIRKVLLPGLAAVAVAAPVADAHTLSKKTAKQQSAKATAALVSDLGGDPAYNCTRLTKHKVDCQVSVVTLDGSACVTVVRVSYRSHRSTRPSRRIVSGPDCEVPELPEIL